MARRSKAKPVTRTLEQIRAEMLAVEATVARIRKLLDSAMSVIRSSRFTLYIVDDDGKRKRNPALKDVRELEGTLRSATRHLSALRIEEARLLETAPVSASPFAEFRQGGAA